jgi:acyl-CoA thioester hydrolase
VNPEPDHASDPLEGFQVWVDVAVAWGDMDAFAHVNNTVYFRWFETSPIAYLERIGFRTGAGVPMKIGPILASTGCRFRRPVTFPDRIRVGARVTEIMEDRLIFEHRVMSHTSGALVAEGTGVVVTYDYERGIKAKVPDAVREAIASLGE